MRWLRIVLTVVFLGLALVIIVFGPTSPSDLSALLASKEGYAVEILRDSWGVPHIFGQTDGDVAFGLAYAHAEDDFLTIQQTLVAARGQLGAIYGVDAAANDYMVALLRIWDVVDAKYETALGAEIRVVCEAYADGLNYYAALHPELALPGLFPLSGRDIVAASVHKSPLFFGLDATLIELFEAERQNSVSLRGSNTFSVAPGRTTDGSTFLAINSHQPWTGPVAWYEVHLHSQEGWNMVGGLFPGMPIIAHGHNQDLGWAFTVNHPDLVDVYVLEMNPDNENQYRFDGQWHDLEVRQATIRVKIVGRLVIPVKREVLWSRYGPVVRQDHGVYALRYAGMGTAGLYEQLYQMNKATNFNQWQAAMAMGQIPSFNVGYADREGNIYYLYNGLLPVRNEHYDWQQYLPGNTSETLWTDYLPFEQLPQVLNPPAGFVQNGNSTPFQATIGPGNPNPANFSSTLGIENYQTNRALRALALFGGDEQISWEEFVAYKFDVAYSQESVMATLIERLGSLGLPAGTTYQTGLMLLQNWDLRATPDSQAAALAVLTFGPFALDPAGTISDEQLLEAFTAAVDLLQQHYGRVDPPWQEVNRLQRGSLDLGLGGAPDVLHAVYGQPNETGQLVGVAGDSYILLVRWDSSGRVTSYSIHQFGTATLDPTSPHYADQAPLFVANQLRPVWFTETDIRANLERAYQP